MPTWNSRRRNRAIRIGAVITLVVAAVLGMLKWRPILGPGWAWVDQWNGAIIALFTVLTAGIAILALSSTIRDSRDRSRPMIIAELRQADHSATLDLDVRNAGPSMAREVSVTFEPELAELHAEEHSASTYPRRQFAKPLACVAPGQE